MKIMARPVAGCDWCAAYSHNPDDIDRPCDRKHEGRACRGRFKKLTEEQIAPCSRCKGSGRRGEAECEFCRGQGWVDVYV